MKNSKLVDGKVQKFQFFVFWTCFGKVKKSIMPTEFGIECEKGERFKLKKKKKKRRRSAAIQHQRIIADDLKEFMTWDVTKHEQTDQARGIIEHEQMNQDQNQSDVNDRRWRRVIRNRNSSNPWRKSGRWSVAERRGSGPTYNLFRMINSS